MRLLALLSLALLFGPVAHAQTIPSIDPLALSVSPQYPRPYETVTATVSSTLLDLASSEITFYQDGKILAENERKASVKLGGPGTKTSIRVVVKGDGVTSERTITVAPADVSLVVEPSSTVPAFYLGAPLPAPEGSVRLVAVTDFRTAPGTSIAPESLVYNWKLGDRQLTAESGIGKNVLTAVAPTRYRDARILLTVTTRDKALVGQASVVVAPVSPVVRIYRNDPLLGIDFARALEGTFALPGAEEAFRAVPYHFKTPPVLSWTLNGSETGTDPDLTVRTTGGQAGSALLGVAAKGEGLFANAERSITIEFGRTSSGSLFGF